MIRSPSASSLVTVRDGRAGSPPNATPCSTISLPSNSSLLWRNEMRVDRESIQVLVNFLASASNPIVPVGEVHTLAQGRLVDFRQDRGVNGPRITGGGTLRVDAGGGRMERQAT